MTEYIHTRYQRGTIAFWDKLKELGFEEKGSDSPGLGIKQIKCFVKGHLSVEDSYYKLVLYVTPKPPSKQIPIKVYDGLSVNKDLLENFAKKGIYHVDYSH